MKPVSPLILLALCVAATAGVAARDLPLPRPKPDKGDAAVAAPRGDPAPAVILAPPMEAFAADPEPAPAVQAPAEASACQMKIGEEVAVIEAQPPLIGPGDCGATDVVKLEAIILKDKTHVAVTPPAILRCGMADALAHWVRDDVNAAVADLGTTIRTLDNYASFNCRGRNRVAGAKISEHGVANAIDIRGVGLANGKFAGLTDRAVSKEFRDTIKTSTCARFTTVLGPGSDGHHESHIHLDLAARRGGYRLCQWNVLDAVSDIPLPRPRPAEATQARQE